MSNDPVITSKENADHYKWGDSCEGWHLAKSERLSVIQECVPPGKSEVRHYHRNSEQYFYVLRGVATLEVEGVTHMIGAHHGLHVPALAWHQLINRSDEDCEFLVISTPPSHGDRVTEQENTRS